MEKGRKKSNFLPIVLLGAGAALLLLKKDANAASNEPQPIPIPPAPAPTASTPPSTVVVVQPAPAPAPAPAGPSLAAPEIYYDSNGIAWKIENPAPYTWTGTALSPLPSGTYGSPVKMGPNRDGVIQQIEERASAHQAASGYAGYTAEELQFVGENLTVPQQEREYSGEEVNDYTYTEIPPIQQSRA